MKTISLSAVKTDAEQLYRNGDYFCAEAVIAAIRKHFDPDMPEQAIAMGSGFPVGIGGAQCTCGAVSGGVMALGYFFGRAAPRDAKVEKAIDLAKELYDSFKSNHKVLCCKILTKGLELGTPAHKAQCASFTGESAAKAAEIIARELNITLQQ